MCDPPVKLNLDGHRLVVCFHCASGPLMGIRLIDSSPGTLRLVGTLNGRTGRAIRLGMLGHLHQVSMPSTEGAIEEGSDERPFNNGRRHGPKPFLPPPSILTRAYLSTCLAVGGGGPATVSTRDQPLCGRCQCLSACLSESSFTGHALTAPSANGGAFAGDSNSILQVAG